MSDANERYIIDQMVIEDEKLVLIITDLMEWSYCVREDHAHALKAKINDYLQFIGNGQVAKYFKDEEYNRIVIRVIAKCSYSMYGLDFFERCRKWIQENGDLCELEWTHLSKDSGEETEFQDGFCDDYIFELDKIYPRIKKNWSKMPTETVVLMAANNNFNNQDDEKQAYNNSPMFRIHDSYIITLIQDMGSTYLYLTYENLPDDTDIEALENKAFENLFRDVTYRMMESKEEGVYGLVSGGNFEAEALCLPCIWEDCSEVLQDDLLIAVPTRDVVLFTRAGDKKSIRKMIKLAWRLFEDNREQSPILIFSRDVFYYNRSTKQFTISKKYHV